ncbi:MAG: MBL fold metallo-hydrolase [Bacteroidetes bacterium]|nr:MBL fold metallo-hydrolase [Bacteroidota bacterium]
MSSVHLLGTGGAVADRHRTTTMLAFTDAASTFLVDCGGDTVHRMLSAGINPDTVFALVITHTHPDHISGFPLLMEKLWLHGRRRPLPVYGIQEVIDLAQHLWEAFEMAGWKDFPKIDWHVIPHERDAMVFANHTWKVTASPGVHSIPVIGLRIESRTSGQAAVYSCDTEPCDAITALAKGAEILLHEANGAGPGHSSADQAAQIAADAGVRELVLVHLSAGINERSLDSALQIFRSTRLGVELGEYNF